MEGVGGRTLVSAVLSAILAVFSFPVCSRCAPGEFDPGRAAFHIGFRDEITPYRVTGVFALPGEVLPLEIPQSDATSVCDIHAASGRVVKLGSNKWTWEAPRQAGLVPVVIRCPALADSAVLNIFVMVPFDSLRDGHLNGYCIGEYPSVPLNMLPAYSPPKGFIEVTEDNLRTLLSPHFRLGQFICKQGGEYPKYVVLRERLILKLELILEQVNLAGYRYDTFHVMSAYRTPHYNRAIGNVKYSRHLWGGAADIFLDKDLDGMMDDLNRDGTIDYRDADAVYDIVDKLFGKPWYERFLGGLARYESTSSHGPFVHVDVRGARARWGE